jgi:hypothetical protein
MNIVTAPQHYYKKHSRKALFLAGGISNCPNWQTYFIEELTKPPVKFFKVDVLNPRRENFDTSNSEAESEQITWEFDMLQQADVIAFWFPKETDCPITLYELGFQMGRYKYDTVNKSKTIVIGTDPEYRRRSDVLKQANLVHYFPVFDSLDAVISEVKMQFNPFGTI